MASQIVFPLTIQTTHFPLLVIIILIHHQRPLVCPISLFHLLTRPLVMSAATTVIAPTTVAVEMLETSQATIVTATIVIITSRVNPKRLWSLLRGLPFPSQLNRRTKLPFQRIHLLHLRNKQKTKRTNKNSYRSSKKKCVRKNWKKKKIASV